MASAKVILLDEFDAPVGELTVQADEPYQVNDHFRSHEGALYFVCAVREGDRPADQEVTAVWIDGPIPARSGDIPERWPRPPA
jgi:hypothetical protein